MPRGRRPGALRPFEEQVFSQVQINYKTDCWEWTGYVDTRPGYLPYGRIKLSGNKTPQALHRIVWEYFNGPIPDGFVVDHICRNGKCCYPVHLRVITGSENSDGGFVKKFKNATQCKHGHPFNELNTIPRTLHGKVIGRYCRVCRTHGPAKDELLIKLGLPLEG